MEARRMNVGRWKGEKKMNNKNKRKKKKDRRRENI